MNVRLFLMVFTPNIGPPEATLSQIETMPATPQPTDRIIVIHKVEAEVLRIVWQKSNGLWGPTVHLRTIVNKSQVDDLIATLVGDGWLHKKNDG